MVSKLHNLIIFLFEKSVTQFKNFKLHNLKVITTCKSYNLKVIEFRMVEFEKDK